MSDTITVELSKKITLDDWLNGHARPVTRGGKIYIERVKGPAQLRFPFRGTSKKENIA